MCVECVAMQGGGAGLSRRYRWGRSPPLALEQAQRGVAVESLAVSVAACAAGRGTGLCMCSAGQRNNCPVLLPGVVDRCC